MLLSTGCSVIEATSGAEELPETEPTNTEQPTSSASAATTTASTTTTAPTTTTPPTTLAPDQLAWPTDAATTAAALSEAETQLRVQVDEIAAAQWGRRQQELYQVLSLNRDWADQAVSLVDESVRQAVELNWLARQELSALVRSGPLSDTLPAWRINEPPSAATLVEFYKAAEAETGVPWTYLAAIHLVETRVGRIEGLSTAGAVGPMQFLPSTWEWCCTGDPTDHQDAITGAATYLTLVGAPADMDAAIFGYNHSDRYVAAVNAYAEAMQLDERAFVGYHAWEVYFSSSVGVLRLETGYETEVPIDAAAWLADHPDDLLGS